MIQNMQTEETPTKPVEQPVERTNPFEGSFSPSSVETARCFRKFYYTKVLKMSPKVTPVALIYGIAIHSAVEKFYQLRAAGTDTQDEVKLQVVKEFARVWNEYQILGDDKRSLNGGILTMSGYVDNYFTDMDRFEMEDIETAQWMPMPNGTMMLCKLDRVLARGGVREVHDTKTSSMPITDFWFKQFENHLPTSLYFHVVEKILGRCDSVVIDAIKVPPPSATSKTAAFGRSTFLRTDLQIEDAISTYCARTDYIRSSLAKPQDEWPARFFCNQGECDKWGGCPFLPVCKHGLSHPSVRVDFDIGGSSA